MINKIKTIIKEIIKKLIKSIEYLIIETLYKSKKKDESQINNKEKSIMILISKLNNGGAERVAANISNEISKKYNLILVTCVEKTDEDYKCDAKRIVLDNNKKKIFKNLSLVQQLKRIKRENSITHTISFCSKMNYLNVMSKVDDVAIISIRNNLSESEKEIKNKHINKIAGKYSDKITVVSKMLIQDQVDNFNAKNEKISAIYNFCNEEDIDNKLKEENSIDLGDKAVINVGRLSYQKGQAHLIRAFKRVVDFVPDAKLYILGQGDLKRDLELEIEKNSLEKNVFLLGFQTNPYIYMQKSCLFVLSSFYEGMSNVILEAMYCGLPVVSTDCRTGTREIIAPNTALDTKNHEKTFEEYGVLVPVIKDAEDENIIADAIIEMLNNNELRNKYKKKSKERISDFSKDKLINKWVGIIE